MTPQLTSADLRFINLVAARRFTDVPEPRSDDSVLAACLGDADAATAHERAALLAGALVRRHAFAVAPLQTVLLVIHCALVLEGFTVLAPQGAAVGMLRELGDGGDPAVLARWLEDRAVPTASA